MARAEWLAPAGDIKFSTLFQVIFENGFCVYAIGGIQDIGYSKGLLRAIKHENVILTFQKIDRFVAFFCF